DTHRNMRRKTHQTIRDVTNDIETMHLNTAVSAMMELTNELARFVDTLSPDDEAGRLVFSEAVDSLILLLSPFAPHIADELWERLGHDKTTWEETWPTHDEAVAAEEVITIVVQVNGKVRDRIEVPAGTSMDQVAETALERPNVRRYVEGKQVREVIKVPNRLVNIVVQ
ncbi:MAG: class I tRNA ligase family protein, partial [Armatimonadetes bacterium]|nr:class I tRNA ligase family protein [Armatimonadota bacterium]